MNKKTRIDKQRFKVILSLLVLLGLIAIFIFLRFMIVPARPNILLITLDALRADHLSCYGYERHTSPHIDELAKEGTMFNWVISQIPETQSSVSSYFTSTYPSMHYRDYKKNWTYLNPNTPSLARILKNAGYHTGLITDFPETNQLFRIYGIKNGFDTCFQTSLTNNPEELSRQALKWLKNNRDKRFFLYLHYLSPHAPYSPSLPYSQIYLKDTYNNVDKQVPIAKDDNYDIFDLIPQSVAEKDITSVNYYRCKYDGKISVVDEQIGFLLEGIKRLHLDKNTLIVLMADHAESLGEHHLYFKHGFAVFDEQIRVPLIIKYPVLIPKDKRISYQAQLIDIVPTILDILGIKNVNDKYMEGDSLLPVILDKKYHPKEHYAFGLAPGRIIYFVRTGNYKLLYIDFKKIEKMTSGAELPTFIKTELKIGKIPPYFYLLFNLKEDTYEKHNLADEEKYKHVFNLLKNELSRFVSKVESEYESAQKGADAFLKIHTIAPLDKEAIEKLRSLGYVQ